MRHPCRRVEGWNAGTVNRRGGPCDNDKVLRANAGRQHELRWKQDAGALGVSEKAALTGSLNVPKRKPM